jgi:hypothetical protein
MPCGNSFFCAINGFKRFLPGQAGSFQLSEIFNVAARSAEKSPTEHRHAVGKPDRAFRSAHIECGSSAERRLSTAQQCLMAENGS